MLRALYILDASSYDLIYGPAERADLAALVDVYAPPQTRQSVADNPAVLHDADVILSGWGAPTLDAAFLAQAPHLKAVFYGAGSIRGIVSDAFWERGIIICSAWAANGVPVAEYTVAQVYMCLKRAWQHALAYRQSGQHVRMQDAAGGYGSVVGIISLGIIGRRVCAMLHPSDLTLIAYDPFVSPEEAAALGVELCSLEEVFRRADVVSLHTPWLKETENMITGAHFRALPPGATFINTARGAVVCEPEMVAVLQERPDLFAVLDVTYPEPPVAGSPLYTLPNVFLTPHIAGSMGRECHRMGRTMVDELRRYLAGEPLHWSISRARAATLA